MDDFKKPAPGPTANAGEDAPRADRRRIGRIVHDDRGTAIVEWQEVPPEQTGRFARVPLSIDDGASRGDLRREIPYRPARGYDPYQRVGDTGVYAAPGKPKRRDLRKLGEWLKLKREMEERKAKEGGED